MDIDKLNNMTGHFDVRKMVDGLMELETKKHLRRLDITKKINDLQYKSFDALSNLLNTFVTSLNGIYDAFNQTGVQPESSVPTVATAMATTNGVPPGTHTINVTNIATQQIDSSTTFSSSTSALNVGETLTFTNNANPPSAFSVEINMTDSLYNIASNINTQASNFGLTASVVMSTAEDGVTPEYTLVLTSNETGAVNGFTIEGDSGNVFNFTQTQEAINSSFTFDNYNEVSASNTIGNSDGTGGVLSGLSLTLLAPGTTVITIGNDNSVQNENIATAVDGMISAYNDVIKFIDKTQFDRTTSNPSFSYIKSLMQNMMNKAYSGNQTITSLFNAGLVQDKPYTETVTIIDPWDDKQKPKELTLTSLGSLLVNQGQIPGNPQTYAPTFATQLADNFEEMSNFFMDPKSGLIANMTNLVNNTITIQNVDNGVIFGAEKAIKTQNKSIDQQMKLQNKVLDKMREDLTLKWSQINAAYAKFEFDTDALTQQFDSMSKMGRRR